VLDTSLETCRKTDVSVGRSNRDDNVSGTRKFGDAQRH
jgi:hypothetical protein